MKELTKSAARLSWALFVYGAQEMAGGRQREEREESTDTEEHLRNEADQLAEETHSKLEEEYRSLYELGEKTGERMIDLGFELMDPRRAMDRAVGLVKWFADKTQREADGAEGEDDAEDGES